MTPTAVFSEIQNCLDLLLNKDMAILKRPVVKIRDGSAVRVTWQPQGSSDSRLTLGEFATVDEYCEQVRNEMYSAMLRDGSLLQVSYDFTRRTLVGHRLCYYPCPFEMDPDDLRMDPVLDVLDVYRTGGEEHLRLRSPLRFDHDAAAAAPGHPASHVHMLSARCRCAVVAPLSLGHFIRFVFWQFYPDWWQRHEFLREWKQELGGRTITPAEEEGLHFACRR